MPRPKRSEVVDMINGMIENTSREIAYFKNERRFTEEPDTSLMDIQRQDYNGFKADLERLKRYIETDA
jgi:hypothetical protein